MKNPTKHPLYKTWGNIKQRCHNPNNRDYPLYGGRGIEVCLRWRESFDKFIEDVGPRPEGYTLDRIDNNKGYYKDNCRWATLRQQMRNTRTKGKIPYKGVYKDKRPLKKPYGVIFRIGKKTKNLGRYATPEEAAEVYKQACLKYRGEYYSG